jgi:RTX calcium-binding nonapeptide repeat (4 copies)
MLRLNRLVLAAAVLLPALLVPVARGATVSSLSVYSDPDHLLAAGVPRVAYPGGPEVLGVPHVDGDGGIEVWARVAGEGVGVDVAPPPGEVLRPYNWTMVERYPFQDPGTPGLAMSVGTYGCNEVTGRLEVLDVGFDGQGAVTRLWALFDHHCEGRRASAFGELRWRAWVPAAAAHVTPAVVRWPVLDSWWLPAAPATVVYHGTAPPTRVALAGADAGHFAVRADACTGQAAPCAVEVGFVPTAPGARRARLEITDAAGATHAVTLEGFLHGGTTRADIEVLAGDVAALPEDRGMHSYEPANALFAGLEHAANPVVSLRLQDRDDRRGWWFLDFSAGAGQKLQPGASYPDALGSAAGPGPGARIDGGLAVCNQSASAFSVHSISYLPDGRLRSFDTSFERRCYEDQRAAARGTWRFRVGDDVALPEWMVPGPRPQMEVPADPGRGDLPGPGSENPGRGDLSGPGSAVPGRGDLPGPGSDSVPPGCGQVAARRLLLGTRGADRLRGTPHADLIRGRAGRDRIHARAGADCVFGGPGADLLVGGRGRDLLDCGPGRRDRAVAGRRDRVRNCERRLSPPP